MKAEDLTGRTFGSWLVIKRIDESKPIKWLCRCECGNERAVLGASLKSGVSKGCQRCIWKRMDHPRVHKDGSRRWIDGKPTHIYSTWLGIRQRCNNPKNKSYKNYGGRGVKICDEWNKDFQLFFDHVSQLEHYGEEDRTIDRIDNNKGYEPGNIRWATRSEQEHNKRAKRI